MNYNEEQLNKKLWNAADALRGNISSEQYMLVIIGIIFIKSVSDKYDRAVVKIKKNHPGYWEESIAEGVPDKDTLVKYNCSFFIPEEANWKNIIKYASKPEIGKKIDDALLAIEKNNEELRGLLDKHYSRPELDQRKLGMVVSEFANLNLIESDKDTLGRIYEFFLGHFFKKQGQKGGEFYTPFSIVKLLVELIQPDEGMIYDPACGTGGMFLQSEN